MLDITKRKELERQLAQSQTLEAIGQLAAGVAHEINTPMQCVFSNVEYLQSSIAKVFELADSYRSLPFSCELSENLVSQIDAIEQLCRFESVRAGAEDAIREAADGSQRVIEIVRAMKTMSHPGTANKTPTDLNRLLTDAIIIARNHWNHVANLRVDLDPDIGEFPALPAPLSQVILNLLINAADAIAEKLGSDPVERGEIIVRSYSTGDGVGIEVQDSGCGIPENIKDRIFDPFYTTKEVGKGTGQGLAIAYDVVVNRHQGRIDACASPGGGTLFCVWLPKYRVAAGRVVELPADRNN
jgi:signal transduction histidine kinase